MQNKIWLSGVATVIFAGAIAAGAQEPTTSTSTSQQRSDTITATGCLQEGSAAAGSAASSTPSATPSGAFMLTNAKKTEASPSSSSTSTAGTTSSSATGTSGSATGTTYLLDGSAVDLKAHVNHQIQVTGKLEASSSSTTSTTGAASSSSSAMSMQKIKVDSVKMVASTCSAQ